MRRLGRNTAAVVPILVINLIFTFTVPGISSPGTSAAWSPAR